MLTYTGQRNLYGDLTDTTTANLTLGDKLINAETRRLVAKMSGHLLARTGTGTTTAGTQAYELPNRVKKLRTVVITVGSTRWPVRRSTSREHWDSVNIVSSSSDIPVWYFEIGRQVLVWPTPASSSNTITYEYDARHIDLSVADYTTGTIATATSASTGITGSGSSWNSSMAGRYIQITKSGAAATNGDGDFYEISSVTNTTTLVLVKPYAGTSISGGSATYLIGEVSLLPDGFHELPVYRATQIYYSKKDREQSLLFKGLADELEKGLLNANDPNDSMVLDSGESEQILNPNLTIQL